MKKRWILGLIIALLSVSSYAQNTTEKTNERAKILTDSLKSKLKLSEEQYTTAYQANLNFLIEKEKLLKVYKGRYTDGDYAIKLKKLNQQRKQTIYNTLTETQQGQFTEYKKELPKKKIPQKTKTYEQLYPEGGPVLGD